MKSAWMIATVLAALVAGVGGGVVATEFMSQQQAPVRKVQVAHGEPDDVTPAGDNSAEVRELNAKLATLDLRLSKAEDAVSDRGEYEDQIAALKTRIDEFEKAGPVVATTDDEGNPVAAPDPESDAFKAAVERFLDERDEQERAERQQQREEWINQRREQEKERIVTTMTEKLALTPLQQENIKVVLDDYNKKRGELMTRGMEARRSGEEFDWRGEREKIETEVKNSIEAELSLSQVSSFQELVGEGEVDDIGEERGGRRGGFRGGRGGGRGD